MTILRTISMPRMMEQIFRRRMRKLRGDKSSESRERWKKNLPIGLRTLIPKSRI
jgi:hypothetical protein